MANLLAEACLARQRAVAGETRGACVALGCHELGGQVGGGAEVRLIWRLAREGRVWHLGVVLLDVEFDQGPETLEGIQGVEIEPLASRYRKPSA
jgi:hypothetical protein